MAKRGKLKGRSQKRNALGRPIRYRAYKQFFLIVCEDQKTEPYYFKLIKDLFPNNTVFLRAVGTGFDPLGVVRESIKQSEILRKEAKKEVDFTWAVFDKDDADSNFTRIQNFAKSYSLAKKHGVKIALSNECFELWLLLHFVDVDPANPIPRSKIYSMLEKQIQKSESGFIYEHGNSNVIDLVAKYGVEENAKKRAIVLEKHHGAIDKILQNPSSDLYKLISELRGWIRFYNWEP